jgi:hypothetical protein
MEGEVILELRAAAAWSFTTPRDTTVMISTELDGALDQDDTLGADLTNSSFRSATLPGRESSFELKLAMGCGEISAVLVLGLMSIADATRAAAS